MKNPMSQRSFDIFSALSEEPGKDAVERRLSEDPSTPVLSHFSKDFRNGAVAMKVVRR